MTKQEAINALLAWWRSQIGYREGANNYTKYAEDAALTKLYGWKPQNQPWCDIVYDAGMIACFGLEAASKMTYQPIGQGSAACRYSAGFYSAHNAFFNKPEAGDQIFFYYEGEINHTGVVEKVESGVVYTIEGNSSDMVARRSYSIGNSAIAGYGRPKWEVVASDSVNNGSSNETVAAPISSACTVTVTLPAVKYGDIGNAVKLMQQRLITKGFSCGWYGADGEYGNATKAALKAFQAAQKLNVDCICGAETWAALLTI